MGFTAFRSCRAAFYIQNSGVARVWGSLCKIFRPLRIRTVGGEFSAFMYKSQPMRLSISTIARQKISQSLHVVTSGSRLWIYMVIMDNHRLLSSRNYSFHQRIKMWNRIFHVPIAKTGEKREKTDKAKKRGHEKSTKDRLSKTPVQRQKPLNGSYLLCRWSVPQKRITFLVVPSWFLVISWL